MPVTLDLAILFALSAAGILFVIISRSVAAKRIVAPATILIFSATLFLIAQRSGALSNVPAAAIVAALAVNAVVMWRRLGYCTTCGRTVFERSTSGRCRLCDPSQAR